MKETPVQVGSKSFGTYGVKTTWHGRLELVLDDILVHYYIIFNIYFLFYEVYVCRYGHNDYGWFVIESESRHVSTVPGHSVEDVVSTREIVATVVLQYMPNSPKW